MICQKQQIFIQQSDNQHQLEMQIAIKGTKAVKVKVVQGSVVHPTIFSISIFQSVEEFLAVYLGLESRVFGHRMSAGKHLENILHRTKSPPIALTYTKQFLLLTSESEIQLTIIRFISQLSDLSAGKSMQASLSYIIENSAFLTELRHNLTHRVMVKGLVISRGKQMILNELKQKYWKVMFDKIWQTYYVDNCKVQKIYEKISQFMQFKESQQSKQCTQNMKQSRIHKQYQLNLQIQTKTKLSPEYLFSSCNSNYQFKSLIHGYILKRVLPQIQTNHQDPQSDDNCQQIQISEDLVHNYFNLSSIQSMSVFNTRCVILFCTLFQVMLTLHKYQEAGKASIYRQVLSKIIVKLIQAVPKLTAGFMTNGKGSSPSFSLFASPIVLKKLRQIFLLKYIKQYDSVLKALPEETILNITKFWDNRKTQLGKKISLDL